MTLSDADKQRLFPSDDPATWNEGVWPPAVLRERWRELFTATLTAALSHPLRGAIGIGADMKTLVRRHAEGAALIASEAADQALRLELERGVTR